VTDANVVLGYLPSALAGGEITLDRDAARAAVQTVADAMGLSLEAAAAGIVDIVNENMLGGLRLVSVQQGFDPRDFALVAFGGAGPLHANALGRLTGAWPVIVPPSPGVLCALGDATTSARDEAARTVLRKLGDLSGAEFAEIFTGLAAAASTRLTGDLTVTYSADVRFFGQGNDIPITFDLADGVTGLAARFDAEHERLFSFTLPVDHELVNARATVTGPRPRVAPIHLEKGDGNPAAARTGGTRIYVDGGFVEAALYDRLKLRAGDVVPGPAIVTEMDSTTLILPGHAATTDAGGSLLIREV
jgi:N-methylhydantoinase A